MQATINISFTPKNTEELLAIISAIKGSAAVSVALNPQSQVEKDADPWIALYETRAGKRFRLSESEKSSGKTREDAARERCLSLGWSLDSDAEEENEEGVTLPEGLAIPSPEELEG